MGTAKSMHRARATLMRRVKNDAKPSPCEESLSDIKKRVLGMRAVNHWFRHTSHAVQSRLRQSKEEEFRSFLRAALVKERKNRLEIRNQLRQEKREARESAQQSRGAVPCPTSHADKKRKKMTPKRNQQNLSSVTLGDDPELDKMIEDIVQEFIHDSPKEEAGETQARTNAGADAVEFDDSAVLALREAARDVARENANISMIRGLASRNTGAAEGQNGTVSREKGSDVGDERIADMIEQLIGEVAQDSSFRFDENAVEALKEAATEIVEGGRAEGSCGGA